MQLGKRSLGIAFGTVWGCAIMFGTWFLLLTGARGQMFSKLSTFYLGYSTSFGGSLIGFVYGFATGFIGGFLIAWVYNIANKALAKK